MSLRRRTGVWPDLLIRGFRVISDFRFRSQFMGGTRARRCFGGREPAAFVFGALSPMTSRAITIADGIRWHTGFIAAADLDDSITSVFCIVQAGSFACWARFVQHIAAFGVTR